MRIDPALISDLLQEGMAKGAIPFVTIISGSMLPLLRKDDQVGLESVTANLLRPGDIITFQTPTTLMTHRYWGQHPSGIITRGDRPLSFDPAWPPHQLVGRVIIRRRSGRELPLTHGLGKTLNTYLNALAHLETRLFAGFNHNPLTPSAHTWLGTTLKANRHNLIARLVRRTLFIMATIPIIISNFVGQK